MTEKEIKQLKEVFNKSERSNEISFGNILKQIEIFEKGIPFLKLNRPCKIGDGIIVIPEEKHNQLINKFQDAVNEGRVMKFVPASGAASRMFKHLQSVSEKLKDVTLQTLQTLIDNGDTDAELVKEFIEKIKLFAFYPELEAKLSKGGYNIDELLSTGNYKEIIKYTLEPKGLNYAHHPKGSIKFHHYPDGAKTAFEEHLAEALNYAKDKNNIARIHFTIAPEQTELIRTIIDRAIKQHKENGYSIEVTYSYQKPSTDIIAVTVDNKPFTGKDGKLVFRPAGHGALLENLNDLKGDLIFIKNIDNIVPDHLKEETYRFKKILAGYLIELNSKIHSYLNRLGQSSVNDLLIAEIHEFAANDLSIYFQSDFVSLNKEVKRRTLFEKLNRPVRVCGMVKNEGHAGGGPFWVEEKDGSVSLQIVEKTQIDLDDESQKKILESSTHFNPVDLVCAVKDYRGKPFNLLEYTNPGSGLITIKSKDGKELKALELPGLWNGSMAKWITVFVEVPRITFNPVKEVNNLLWKEHQPKI
ncbi:hypothetical protein BMS3Abin03_03069 [bacterium BMS3Abin03]|nr:hypothetical protein BMS3Abin03_03069 [bacterium BMS3Abin03]